MKLHHNVNPHWERPSAVVDDAYAHEVRRSTERAERLFLQSEVRLAKAEARLLRAKSAPRAANRKQQIKELEMMVELRRLELEKYRRMMVAVASSLAHRGVKGYRPVGYGGAS